MILRPLKRNDSIPMLEWMKDSRVNCFFRFDSQNVTIKSVTEFINSCVEDNNNYHFAIADDNDIYQGTISLKNIDIDAGTGEYAIALHYEAQGKGIGTFATKQLLKYAFETLNLNRVYLNVLEDNINAIKLYKKCGFIFEGEFKQHIKIQGQFKNLKWYGILKENYYANR
ncbi:GNAT family N-acetyltransferase [Clostridium sp. CF012]|uniref:GNAT family N-acetyltransferase n=1 Tax=Clostridium sp. CF012 TaxID=2843319 RepID=UPI001C0DB90F|nr:GNAT family protein [Clostridium sp. CF012]MBU3143466.1 GNAT family N-acetyltransferase [Clostridium sp. CF012]